MTPTDLFIRVEFLISNQSTVHSAGLGLEPGVANLPI